MIPYKPRGLKRPLYGGDGGYDVNDDNNNNTSLFQ